MPYKFNPLSGALDYYETSSGGDLWSDPVDAHIVPDGNGTRDLGDAPSNYFRFILGGSIWAQTKLIIKDGGNTDRLQIDGSTSPPSGATVTGSISTTTYSDSIAVFTKSNATANGNATGSLYFETGDKTAGSGVSGAITLETGTTAGANSKTGDIILSPGIDSSVDNGCIDLNGNVELAHVTYGGAGGTATMPSAYTSVIFTGANALTLTLPTAVSRIGSILTFVMTGATNALTIDGLTTETIGGSLTQVLSGPNDSLIIQSDGTNWQIVSTTTPAHNEVWAYTSNGTGSGSTKILQLTTAGIDVGTAITRASDTILGDTFTINENGVYSITATCQNSDGNREFGITRNQTTLTTNITANPVLEVLASTDAVATNLRSSVSVTARLAATDVIRLCTDSNANFSTTVGDCGLRIIKLSGSQ